MTGNPVKIGDGCATVTDDNLPRMPLCRLGRSNSRLGLHGKAGARHAVRSQDTGLAVLIGSDDGFGATSPPKRRMRPDRSCGCRTALRTGVKIYLHPPIGGG